MRVRHVAMMAAVAIALAITDGRARAQAAAPLRTIMYASGFATPLAFVQDPSDPAVQFVVEQGGRIRAMRNGTVLAPDFLDLRDSVLAGGEQGMLGLAFAPDGRAFVNFTNRQGHTVIARFRRSANPAAADVDSRFDLAIGDEGERFIRQPAGNHNGGNLAFGPDGYLYIGMGDGGGGNDQFDNAQRRSTVLGKMVRIDVNVPDSDARGYAIPPSNPWRDGALGTRPEIWSFGLRNPWRYSFDRETGALVIGDVGQGSREEIDYEPAGRGGRNYGWSIREGTLTIQPARTVAFGPLTDPIHDLDRSLARSITGGYVYRGTALGTAYRGRYFFGDFITSRVWSLVLNVDAGTGEATVASRTEHTEELGGAGELAGVASFGVDAAGELYIVSYSRGAILKFIALGTPPSPPTGLRIIR